MTMVWKGLGTEMATGKKSKPTHFKNISEFCTVDDVEIHGRPLFLPPGKIVHDENGTMFPTLMATAQRYFVKCDSEAEMIRLGVPEELRDLARGGFRGINFILKELSGDALASEKDRAVLSQTEYAAMKSKAEQAEALALELAKAKALAAAATADAERTRARADEVAKLDALATENQKLQERLAAAERDVARATQNAGARRARG